jgi:hypothetical protein
MITEVIEVADVVADTTRVEDERHQVRGVFQSKAM